MNGNGKDEFFIGWQSSPPPGIARFLKTRVVWIFSVLALGLAAALPVFQNTIRQAWFDFGTVTEFEGLLVNGAAPVLIAKESGASAESVYFLVNPLKYGFDPAAAVSHHLKQVRLKGTLIHDGEGRKMIEALPGSVETIADEEPGQPLAGGRQELGEVVLQGEIVDSKCYIGVMNPGALKPHRACAINCLRGGIPPMLLVRTQDGGSHLVLLTGPDGEAVNEAVLDYVAEPVEIYGKLERQGSLRILRADPSNIRRL